jgi:hypothetical protein
VPGGNRARVRQILPHSVMLVVSGLLWWAATRIDVDTGGRIGPSAWPKAIIAFMALLCVYEIAKRLIAGSAFTAKGLMSAPEKDPRPAPTRGGGNSAMLFGGIGLIAGYVLVVPYTGFFATTALFLAAFPWVGGLRRPVLSVVLGLGGAFALAIVFLRVAYISLPLGEGPFRALSLGLMRLIGVT